MCTQKIYNYVAVNDPVMSKVLIGTIPFLVLALCGWGIVCLLSAGGIFDDSNTGDLFGGDTWPYHNQKIILI